MSIQISVYLVILAYCFGSAYAEPTVWDLFAEAPSLGDAPEKNFDAALAHPDPVYSAYATDFLARELVTKYPVIAIKIIRKGESGASRPILEDQLVGSLEGAADHVGREVIRAEVFPASLVPGLLEDLHQNRWKVVGARLKASGLSALAEEIVRLADVSKSPESELEKKLPDPETGLRFARALASYNQEEAVRYARTRRSPNYDNAVIISNIAGVVAEKDPELAATLVYADLPLSSFELSQLVGRVGRGWVAQRGSDFAEIHSWVSSVLEGDWEVGYAYRMILDKLTEDPLRASEGFRLIAGAGLTDKALGEALKSESTFKGGSQLFRADAEKYFALAEGLPPKASAEVFAAAVTSLCNDGEFQSASSVAEYSGGRTKDACTSGIVLAARWALADPVAAAEWVSGHHPEGALGAYHCYCAQALVRNWAAIDPPAAARWIASQPSAHVRSHTYLTLAIATGSSDATGSLRTAALIADSKFLDDYLRSDAFVAVSEVDPEQARAFVREMGLSSWGEKSHLKRIDSILAARKHVLSAGESTKD